MAPGGVLVEGFSYSDISVVLKCNVDKAKQFVAKMKRREVAKKELITINNTCRDTATGKYISDPILRGYRFGCSISG
jgi:hypothetical protein